MKILIDVMGGDNAPEAAITGALDAIAQYPEITVVMIGDRDAIRKAASEADRSDELEGVEIVHSTSVITMEDSALSVVRAKNDSSMAIGLKMLAAGEGDAFVSAGNTGALHAGSSLIVRRIRGVHRSAIASVLPFAKPVLLIDSGANIEIEPSYLRQFAIMGSVYMHHVFGIENPEVGLLNNGTEPTKGTKKLIETHELLSADESINFVGNVESRDVPTGACDVLVTDGFSGNIFLKLTEGLGMYMFSKLRDVLYDNIFTKASALLLKNNLKKLKKSLDVSEYGGAPLLGLSKPVLKTHGSSDAKEFMNAIRCASEFAQTGVTVEIAKRIEADREKTAGAAENTDNSAQQENGQKSNSSVDLSDTKAE